MQNFRRPFPFPFRQLVEPFPQRIRQRIFIVDTEFLFQPIELVGNIKLIRPWVIRVP
jgi:hypothetical protein